VTLHHGRAKPTSQPSRSLSPLVSLDKCIYQYLGGGALGATKPTLCQLRKLVYQASHDNPHLTSRLEKAAFLVLLRPIVLLGEDHYHIGAEDGLRL